ncbi:hypothetical protein FCV25MIE_28326 [Fagus crenata]
MSSPEDPFSVMFITFCLFGSSATLHYDPQNTIFKMCLNMVQICIPWLPKPQELAISPLSLVPIVTLSFLFTLPFPTDSLTPCFSSTPILISTFLIPGNVQDIIRDVVVSFQFACAKVRFSMPFEMALACVAMRPSTTSKDVVKPGCPIGMILNEEGVVSFVCLVFWIVPDIEGMTQTSV